MMNKSFIPPNRSNRAFSLVEVTIALGIASFAILSMLGVLVVGMTTMRSAIDSTVRAQITQDVLGSLRQSDFSTLSDASSREWNYDDRGVAVLKDSQKLYTASVSVEDGLLSGAASNPNLHRVVVSILKVSEPENPHIVSTFIANNGQ